MQDNEAKRRSSGLPMGVSKSREREREGQKREGVIQETEREREEASERETADMRRRRVDVVRSVSRP